MPFGKKFAEKFGEDKTVDVSVANIHAAIEQYLWQMKVIKDIDIYAINIDDIVGKTKPTETVRVVIKLKKEV